MPRIDLPLFTNCENGGLDENEIELCPRINCSLWTLSFICKNKYQPNSIPKTLSSHRGHDEEWLRPCHYPFTNVATSSRLWWTKMMTLCKRDPTIIFVMNNIFLLCDHNQGPWMWRKIYFGIRSNSLVVHKYRSISKWILEIFLGPHENNLNMLLG